MTDVIGPDCKLVWAMDENGEIGKRPTLDKSHFEVSAENYERAVAGLAGRQSRGRK